MNIFRFYRNLLEFVRYAIAPIGLLCMFLLFFTGYRLFGLPSPEELVELAHRAYGSYGYWVVLAAALIEGTLFVNWYFPGSAILVLSILFTGRFELNLAIVFLYITLGFMGGLTLDYLMGRFGWYHLFMRLGLEEPLAQMRKKMEQYGLPVVFSTYFHPNIGALTATSAGILRQPFARFFVYSFFALVFWNALWSLAIYLLGPFVLRFLGMKMIVIVAFGWLIAVWIKFLRTKKSAGPLR